MTNETKFCKFCGEKIPMDAVVCTKCGRQVEELKNNDKQVIINNSVSSGSKYTTMSSDKSKKTALLMCIFGGWFGLHQYYVGNIKRGILYTFTIGLFFIGWITDIIKILLGSFRDNVGAPLRH